MSGVVSLTVEEGVSLVGPHCPGTVRLTCEGVGLSNLGWTYNEYYLIYRIQVDYQVSSSPVYLTNPALVSVYITNISFNSQYLTANFSSVLVVDLLELSKQNIKNITCGDWSSKDTQQVDITMKRSKYFTPYVTATYQSGLLSHINVHWNKLVS